MEISIKWNLCRVCLKEEKNDLVSLYNDAKLAETIQECTGKTIDENDGLPDQICYDCINDLKETHKFLTKFKKSDDHLISIVQRTMSTRSLIQNDNEEKNFSKEQKVDESSNSVLNCKVKHNNRLKAKDSTTTPYKILFSSEEDVTEQRKKKSHDVKENTKSKTDENSGGDGLNNIDNKTANRQTINEDIYIEELSNSNKNVASDEGEGDDEDDTGDNNNDYIIVLNDNETKIKVSSSSNDVDVEFETFETFEENEENEHYKVVEYDNASNQGEEYILSDINCIEQMIEEDDDNDNETTTTVNLQSTELADSEIEDQKIIITSVGSLPKKSTMKSHMCLVCNNTFTRTSSLKTHMRRHRNELKYNCELCPKAFGTSHNLANHMRIHTGEKPYECKYCQRRFADRSTHLKHTRIHTNERPFACDKCGKSFSLSTTLKTHEVIHTGEKPHECLKCNKFFKLPHQLKAHYNTNYHNRKNQAMELDC